MQFTKELKYHFSTQGSRPAILQSLGSTMTSAPLFAYYEGIWKLGINTNLQNDIISGIAQKTL